MLVPLLTGEAIECMLSHIPLLTELVLGRVLLNRESVSALMRGERLQSLRLRHCAVEFQIMFGGVVADAFAATTAAPPQTPADVCCMPALRHLELYDNLLLDRFISRQMPALASLCLHADALSHYNAAGEHVLLRLEHNCIERLDVVGPDSGVATISSGVLRGVRYLRLRNAVLNTDECRRLAPTLEHLDMRIEGHMSSFDSRQLSMSLSLLTGLQSLRIDGFSVDSANVSQILCLNKLEDLPCVSFLSCLRRHRATVAQQYDLLPEDSRDFVSGSRRRMLKVTATSLQQPGLRRFRLCLQWANCRAAVYRGTCNGD